jgi:hypothetical protein
VTTWTKMDGHARDSLVAEKLFGWQSKPCDLEETDGELTIYDSGDACCPRCGVYEHINDFAHGFTVPPHYTTSMDAAWLVVEKLKSEEWFDNLELVYVKRNQRRDTEYIRVNFCFRNGTNAGKGPWDHSYAEAATAPEAICLAALRAIGVEVEKDTE